MKTVVGKGLFLERWGGIVTVPFFPLLVANQLPVQLVSQQIDRGIHVWFGGISVEFRPGFCE